MAAILITIDHDVIRRWAAQRGARPSTCEGDERPWPLCFDFGTPGAGMVEIAWDRFFDAFDRADLAFVYRDLGDDAERDDFHEFVKRSTVPELLAAGAPTIIERVR